jgi:CYTH domain-containing protein
MIEIERKFLVNSDAFKSLALQKNHIVQGYLNSNPNRTVRIRIKDEKGFITIKGASNEIGLSRYEWEKEITTTEAKELLLLCEEGIIDKIRYEIPVGQHLIEVDEFFGNNKGLILAEIELQSESEEFEKPDWLDIEVTQDERYYNSYLSKYPYTSWST